MSILVIDPANHDPSGSEIVDLCEDVRELILQAFDKFPPFIKEIVASKRFTAVSTRVKYLVKAIGRLYAQLCIWCKIDEFDETARYTTARVVSWVIRGFGSRFFYELAEYVEQSYFSYNFNFDQPPKSLEECQDRLDFFNHQIDTVWRHETPRQFERLCALRRAVKDLKVWSHRLRRELQRKLRCIKTVEMSDDYICCICQCEKGDFNEDDDVKVIEYKCCKHQACKGCYTQWSDIKSNCPVCRSPI